ncbi:hypothetical protein [Streptomyces sp. NBC_01483]|uniref:hypothetical protein n=1 Tax=Streptomyces sp. NBC_01483 TaxID=2903883 RepID=UPI002E2FCAF2|nr:hypothetical protein [Streptomyces sp. NBC_01483]
MFEAVGALLDGREEFGLVLLGMGRMRAGASRQPGRRVSRPLAELVGDEQRAGLPIRTDQATVAPSDLRREEADQLATLHGGLGRRRSGRPAGQRTVATAHKGVASSHRRPMMREATA